MQEGQGLILRTGPDGVRVSVTSHLDEVYESLFQNARRAIKRKPDDVRHGIKLTVFGCFWLESVVNLTLQELLRFEVRDAPFSRELWSTIRRAVLDQKLELLVSLGSDSQRAQLDEFRRVIRRTFNTRNQLAHYKYDEELVEEQTWEEFRGMPKPPQMPMDALMKALEEGRLKGTGLDWSYRFQKMGDEGHDTVLLASMKGEKAVESADAIAKAVKWTRAVRKRALKKHGYDTRRQRYLPRST